MSGLIKAVTPRAGVEGGEVIISCEGFDAADYRNGRVLFAGETGHIISASASRVIVGVPEGKGDGNELQLVSGFFFARADFIWGRRLASDLHPVANPAIDPETGNIYVTLSGTRGQKVPVSVYEITPEGVVSPFLSDVMNPTGMAFDRDGTLHVTSRYEGILYRVTPFKETEIVAEDLGVATGLAFDGRGLAYVGDRSGVIHRVNEIGEARPFASLEASVSAYHLAFSPDGDLYATGPTVSSFDSVHRINAVGDVRKFYTGLGRPQGLAFDVDGNCYVAASLRGHRGIVRITPDGRKAEIVVAGANLIGLAFDRQGDMIVVSTQRVYRLPLGIKGYSIA
ncbi:MAG TPA: gluconolaconase [Blastocatellia bacterium]|nr:gluconolaconase [Blastocatellia bacterium]